MPRDRDVNRGPDWADNLPSWQRGVNHLLVIGIDQYLRVGRLANAVRDAQAMRDLLQRRYAFDAAHTRALYDEAATRRALMQ
ncbi:MAG: hypothetical protein OHK0039_34050 [Bacteroidia bacterium]